MPKRLPSPCTAFSQGLLGQFTSPLVAFDWISDKAMHNNSNKKI